MIQAEKNEQGVQTEAKYFIDIEAMEAKGRSMSVMLASRRCPSCQISLSKEELLTIQPDIHLERLVECCSKKPDYIFSTMPLMEATFRLLLAVGNRAMTLQEIHEALAERWRAAGFPKYLPLGMLERMLNHDDYYGIFRVATEKEGEEGGV